MLANDCCFVNDACPRILRLTETCMHLISRMWTDFRDRAFCTAGPQVWNNLPTDLRYVCFIGLNLSYSHFRQSLKTSLGQWDQSAVLIPSLSCVLESLSLTYLLTLKRYSPQNSMILTGKDNVRKNSERKKFWGDAYILRAGQVPERLRSNAERLQRLIQLSNLHQIVPRLNDLPADAD